MKEIKTPRGSGINRRKFLKQSLIISAFSSISLPFSKNLFSQTGSVNSLSKIRGFKDPYGIAIDSNGQIFVSDAAGYCVKVFSNQGKPVGEFGGPDSSGGKLNYPQGLAIDENDNIYVMDSNNGRVAIFDQHGTFIKSIGTIGGYPDAFYTPKNLFIGNKIYACNTRNHFISVFDKNTHQLISKFGDLGDDSVDLAAGSLEYKFRLPTDIVVDSDEKMYIVDSKHGQIKVLDKQGQYLFKFGSIGSGEGQFNSPEGIALDSNKNIYVCDTMNSRIQKFSSDGKFIEAKTSNLTKPTTLHITNQNIFYIVDAEQKQVLITDWKV